MLLMMWDNMDSLNANLLVDKPTTTTATTATTATERTTTTAATATAAKGVGRGYACD